MNTAQEQAWAGEFGTAYQRRSPGNEEANYHLLKRILIGIEINSAVELGAGVGSNLHALRRLKPQADLAAVEINESACQDLRLITPEVYRESILDWEPPRTWDLAFTKGVLIHINPEHLGMVYETLHRAARRWILIAEYYNPTPMSVPYRGEEEMLWKRDFAGELIDRFPLRLVDYGFVYHRDQHPQDDLNWFLLEKLRPTAVEARAA